MITRVADLLAAITAGILALMTEGETGEHLAHRKRCLRADIGALLAFVDDWEPK
jgi:hypothetical protein